MEKLRRHLISSGAALGLASCLWAGCSPGAAPPATTEVVMDPYVGAAACAECHREIFERQTASNHALTLRTATAANVPLDDNKARTKTDAGTGLEYRMETAHSGVRQIVSRDGQEVASATLDYLLGSGHHGISPMNFDGSEWKYLSLTYYSHGGWDFSPMHGLGDAGAREKNAAGWPVSTQELQKCFGCHTTRLAFQGPALNAAQTELGVRCESCHGPGRDHVEAVRGKSTDLAVQNPGKWSSESFMALCQQCHNETATLEGTMMGIPKDPASRTTVKYHVYGFSQSRCFIASKGELRCTTCHDPHGSTESDPVYYEKKCRSCHDGGAKTKPICPVNSQSQCLSCHMPKVEVAKYTQFADHWIRARSPFAPGKRQANAGKKLVATLTAAKSRPR